MTYSILSLTSGNLLASYRSEARALAAAGRICADEPGSLDTLAVVSFDDAGGLVGAVDGAELSRRIESA